MQRNIGDGESNTLYTWRLVSILHPPRRETAMLYRLHWYRHRCNCTNNIISTVPVRNITTKLLGNDHANYNENNDAKSNTNPQPGTGTGRGCGVVIIIAGTANVNPVNSIARDRRSAGTKTGVTTSRPSLVAPSTITGRCGATVAIGCSTQSISY